MEMTVEVKGVFCGISGRWGQKGGLGENSVWIEVGRYSEMSQRR